MILYIYIYMIYHINMPLGSPTYPIPASPLTSGVATLPPTPPSINDRLATVAWRLALDMWQLKRSLVING